MAPKKKPKAEGDSDAFEEFKSKYNKMQKEYETPKIPAVQDIIRLNEEGEETKAWAFDREFDAMAFRVLFHSLRQVNYLDIEAIWVWKCNGKDESVRSVCTYLEMDPPPNVKDLQFTDNGVTELGCEFLGRLFGPEGNKNVNKLVLDFNQFGTPGVEKLSMGLSQNSTLRHLSLNYCAIGEDGGQYLAHILMFIRNALEILDLRGNYLKERGTVDVFHGVKRTTALTRIDMFDNKFSDTPDVIQALRECFAHNTKLTYYDLAGNQISDAGAGMLVNGIIGHGHVQDVKVTERCSQRIHEALALQLSATKGKKKKGKKK